MAERLYCSKGHRWEPAFPVDQWPPDFRTSCPVCGEAPLSPFDLTVGTRRILTVLAVLCLAAGLALLLIPPALPGVILLLIIAGIIPLSFIGIWVGRGRVKKMAEIADAMNFAFLPNLGASSVRAIAPFRLFKQGHSQKAYNAMQGKVGDCDVLLFEYSYTTGSGKSQHTTQLTAAVLFDGAASVPDFQLAPKTFFDKIAGFFTHNSVEIEDAPEFTRRCKLMGPQRVRPARDVSPRSGAAPRERRPLGHRGRGRPDARLSPGPVGAGQVPWPGDGRPGNPRPAAQRGAADAVTPRRHALCHWSPCVVPSIPVASHTRRPHRDKTHATLAAGTALAAVLALAALTPPADAVGPDAKDVQAVLDKGYAFLKKQQGEDGSWSPRIAGPGVTALVVAALLRNGYAADDPVVAKGLDYLEKNVQKDGGIYNKQLANYTTSVALMAFQEANKDGKYDAILKNGVKFLKGLQDADADAKDPHFGGVGYNGKGRPDLSNTQYFIDSLIQAGVPKDDPAIQRALQFVSRCQNLPGETNDQPLRQGQRRRQGRFRLQAGHRRPDA